MKYYLNNPKDIGFNLIKFENEYKKFEHKDSDDKDI